MPDRLASRDIVAAKVSETNNEVHPIWADGCKCERDQKSQHRGQSRSKRTRTGPTESTTHGTGRVVEFPGQSAFEKAKKGKPGRRNFLRREESRDTPRTPSC